MESMTFTYNFTDGDNHSAFTTQIDKGDSDPLFVEDAVESFRNFLHGAGYIIDDLIVVRKYEDKED